MAEFRVVLEILNDGLENLVIGFLAAVEDFQFMLQNEEQFVDVAVLFEQNLNDV